MGTQMCACDPGYSGPSCAQRDCPKGANPVLYALEVTNSVQGIFWRSFNKAGATAQAEQVFASRMPSTVHYTITFTDEYGDEHVTSLLSVEYKSHCESKAGDVSCLSYPDFDEQSLMEHAEAVNQSLGALPRGAIENKYVWTVGTEYTPTTGASTTLPTSSFLMIPCTSSRCKTSNLTVCGTRVTATSARCSLGRMSRNWTRAPSVVCVTSTPACVTASPVTLASVVMTRTPSPTPTNSILTDSK